MDADVKRMLADLGLARRDAVSAPDDDGRGRGPRQPAQSETAVRKDVEARRARYAGEAGGGHDEHSARLNAWNTESNFENDEVTGLLENRFSGQGHRAGLARRMEGRQYDDRSEAMDARVGEERRMYLQERAGRGNSYVASGGQPSGQDEFRQNLLGGRDTTPRSLPGNQNFPNYANAPQRAPNHARAPSPRRQGTIRFGRGGRRVEQPAAPARPLINIGTAAAAAMRAAATNGASAQQQPKLPDGVSDQPAAQASSGRAQTAPSTSSGSSTIVATPTTTTAAPPTLNGPVHTLPTGTATSRASTAVGTPATSVVPSGVVHDARLADLYHIHALNHAANPGEDCDKYYTEHPDRRQYFGRARDQLIRKATELARNNDEAEIATYVKQFPDRKWMVESAKKARKQVENESEEEIEAFCAVHKMQRAFLRPARVVFAPIPTQEIDVVMPTTNTDTEAPISNTHLSNATTEDSSSSNISDSEASAETDITTPPSRLGTLAATFFSAAGNFLGIHHIGVNAPVQATMTVSARTERYDPRELINSIEALAQSMVDRSQGLEGARLAEDGLWEDEEL